jgi:hypothetical protein
MIPPIAVLGAVLGEERWDGMISTVMGIVE